MVGIPAMTSAQYSAATLPSREPSSCSTSNGVWFDMSSGLEGTANVDCASDDGAQKVEGALKALIGIGRLSVPKNQPDLTQVYDAVQVTQEGHRVRLHINVPQSMVDKFLGVWLGQR